MRKYEVCFPPSNFCNVFIKHKNKFVSGRVISIPEGYKGKYYSVKLDSGEIVNVDRFKGDFYKKVG